MAFEQRQEAVCSNVHVEECELVAVGACLAEVGDPTGREIVYTDDNGAMIAVAGTWRLLRGERTSLGVGADPSMRLG